MTISIIEEQRGKQPSDLTDDQWDHGSSDGDIFAVIKRGLPPTMMAGFDGGIPDQDIWNIVNYLRSLRSGRNVDHAAFSWAETLVLELDHEHVNTAISHCSRLRSSCRGPDRLRPSRPVAALRAGAAGGISG